MSAEFYREKDYFDKCSRILEEMADRISSKAVSDIIDRFSRAIQQRQEAIDLQVEGYAMGGSYAGEFERSKAKVKIADTYYVDSAKRLEGLMLDRPAIFNEKDFADIGRLINYYSQKEKAKEIEPLK